MSKFDCLDLEPSKAPEELEEKAINSKELYSKITGKKQTDSTKTIKKNIMFFTGAGFSKAWDKKYPVGLELFSIDDFDTIKSKYNFFKLADDLKIKKPEKDISYKSDETSNRKKSQEESEEKYIKDCYDYFQEIKFHFDIYKRYPSLMPTYLNSSLIIALEDEMKSFIKEHFLKFVSPSELDLDAKIKAKGDQKEFITFFDALHTKVSKLSFISTNYDLVIEKIINKFENSVTLNRGIIDQIQFNKKEWHDQKIDLYKINGGFEIYKQKDGGFCIDHSMLNNKELKNEKTDRTPHIILPSKEQNYDDKYFKSVFLKSASVLQTADLLIFIGYSLPIEDQTIRFLLKNFTDSTNADKEIIIIGRYQKGAIKVKEQADLLFPELSKNLAIHPYNGSFNQFIIDINKE